MKICLLLISYLLQICSVQPDAVKIVRSTSSNRIIGGAAARPAQFPYAAAIFVETANSRHFCGGTIVGKRWILTAGTCVYNAVAFTIYLGSVSLDGDDPNRMILATNDYEIHPEFNPETLENDVGLVKLRMEITYYTTYVSQVRFMPTSVLPSSAFVVALGWGQVSDDDNVPYNDLHYVNVTTISNEECRITYGTQITDEMVCTAGNFNEGTCIGDSGGPLLQDTPMRHFMLVGVASFVSGNGCESLDPSGFSRAFSYMPWLNQVLFGS
ncbi:hypothetical protein MTP99_011198 [Tenebrio molitor]|nr:hypothetical protein MTP99_011198 [Tenebrio molitor]